MKNPSKTYCMVATALCIALGVVLPTAGHMLPNGGYILLPMHIPVLLCGLILGWHYGLICGVATPILCHLITGMPMAAMLPGMVCELAAYGFVAGLMATLLSAKHKASIIYIQLIVAMVAGRIVYGLVNAFIFQVGVYSWEIFVSAAFLTGIPGIIVQLVLIPPLVLLLRRAKVVPLL